MRIELDENIGERGADTLRQAGCDVATVVSQDLCSSADVTLIEICRAERRLLISLDTDFANTLRFRPSRYAGIVVLRLPNPLRREHIEGALRRFLDLAQTSSPVGKLWLIDKNRIREFDEDPSNES